jgi:hypothetical protein
MPHMDQGTAGESHTHCRALAKKGDTTVKDWRTRLSYRVDRATHLPLKEVSMYVGLPPLIVDWDMPSIEEQIRPVTQLMSEKGYQLHSQESFLWLGTKLIFRKRFLEGDKL